MWFPRRFSHHQEFRSQMKVNVGRVSRIQFQQASQKNVMKAGGTTVRTSSPFLRNLEPRQACALTSLLATTRLRPRSIDHVTILTGSRRLRDSKTPAPRAPLYWASQLTSVSFEVAFFVLLGYWGDRRWGTAPWLLLAGSLFGLLVSAWHLWQLVQSLDRSRGRRPGRPD